MCQVWLAYHPSCYCETGRNWRGGLSGAEGAAAAAVTYRTQSCGTDCIPVYDVCMLFLVQSGWRMARKLTGSCGCCWKSCRSAIRLWLQRIPPCALAPPWAPGSELPDPPPPAKDGHQYACLEYVRGCILCLNVYKHLCKDGHCYLFALLVALAACHMRAFYEALICQALSWPGRLAIGAGKANDSDCTEREKFHGNISGSRAEKLICSSPVRLRLSWQLRWSVCTASWALSWKCELLRSMRTTCALSTI